MGNQTRIRLSDHKTLQGTGDTLNLSGNTNFIGTLQVHGYPLLTSGATNGAILGFVNGNITPIILGGYSKSVFVDAINGNDSTAVKGSQIKLYQTLIAAQSAATSGDTIFVYPGLYTDFNLGKNNVNWHFYEGAIVKPTNQISSPIFTDIIGNGPITMKITGNGQFINMGEYGPDTSAIVMGNSNSSYDITADIISGCDMFTGKKLIFRNVQFTFEVGIYPSAGAIAELHNCFLNNTINNFTCITNNSNINPAILNFYNCRFYNNNIYPTGYDTSQGLNYVNGIFNFTILNGSYLTHFILNQRLTFKGCIFYGDQVTNIAIDTTPNQAGAPQQNSITIFEDCYFYSTASSGSTYLIQTYNSSPNTTGVIVSGVTFGFNNCVSNVNILTMATPIINTISTISGLSVDPNFTITKPTS